MSHESVVCRWKLLPLLGALALSGCSRASRLASIVATGYVDATEVRVSTKVAGRVEAVERDEGDKVGAGEVLARIDTGDILLLLDQARAERAQAEADLALRRAGARREDIAELAAGVASARADLEGAQKDLDRMQALLDRGSGTAKARDDTRTRRDIAAGRLAAAEQALGRARSGARPEEIEAARARVAATDARIAILDRQIRDATITSPVTGIVTARAVERGELLAVGAPVAVVTDLADAWLNAYVGELDVPRLRIGQSVEVATDDGQTRPGRITFIASKAEFTPKNVQTRDERVKLVFKVKIALPNEDGLFKPGMPAEATIASSPGGGSAP